MKIDIHIGHAEHHRRWCGAFYKGMRRHGLEPRLCFEHRAEDCDLAVFWGYRRHDIISRRQDYLVLERGFVGDRQLYASAGFNGLNGRADFVNKESPPDRWQRYFSGRLKPWKTGGDYLVVMGQVAGDASLANIDFNRWAYYAFQKARRHGLPVFFRPHPLSDGLIPPGLAPLAGSLEAALKDAAGVITWNSNSAVDAVLAGVPAIVCDRGGMAWPVSAHLLHEPFMRPDRQPWAQNIAYAQWTEEEFISGEAWEHLKRRYARNPESGQRSGQGTGDAGGSDCPAAAAGC